MQKKLLRLEATIYTIILIIMSTRWYKGLISIGADPNETIAVLLFFIIILGLSSFIWFDEPEEESVYEQKERHTIKRLIRVIMSVLILLTFANKIPELIELLK